MKSDVSKQLLGKRESLLFFERPEKNIKKEQYGERKLVHNMSLRFNKDKCLTGKLAEELAYKKNRKKYVPNTTFWTFRKYAIFIFTKEREV